MTTVDSTTDSAGLTLASSLQKTKETGVQTIDQAGFLRLMTTQMQYQDPFSPMDNNQMVAQMAQFSALQNQNDGNKLLQGISDSLTGSRLSDAANWIGKSMLIKSSTATPSAYGDYSGQVTFSSDSSNASIDLVDGTGKTVKKIELGAVKAGEGSFYWDGKDDEGNVVATGPLQVRVNGVPTSQIATWATVAAVKSPASGTDAQLITPLGDFYPKDAISLG